MRNLLVVLLGVVLAFPSFAVKEYYSLSKSIRSLGMGGAFFGLSDDEYSLFSNPAGLSLRRSGTEVMLRANGHVSSKFVDSGFKVPKDAPEFFNGGSEIVGNAGLLPYFLTKNLAVGLLVADTKLNLGFSNALINNLKEKYASFDSLTDQEKVDAIKDVIADFTSGDQEIGDLSLISDSGLVLGYAQSVGVPNLHVGANLKGLFRAGGRKVFTKDDYDANGKININPEEIGGTGIGVDLDLGATYEMDMLPFGIVSRASLVLSNLLATDFSISRKYNAPPKLNRTANLGWYTVFDGFAFVDNVHALVDIANISLGGESNPDLGARTGSFMKKLHLGVELPMGRFSVRAGLNQGYFTAGFGLNLYAVRLDVATYGEEIGDETRQSSRRYALTAAFGWGSAPPAPLAPRVREEKPTPQPVMEEQNQGAANET